MGIGEVGSPDVEALMKLLAPINTQPVQDVVEEAVNREGEMAEKLMKLNVEMKVGGMKFEGLGDAIDQFV